MVRTVVNICFHGIGRPGRELETGEAPYWIAAKVFRGILDALAGRPEVVLSFDDGNVSDWEVALPELVARGLVATFFPLAGRLDSAGSLSRRQVGDLVARGMVVGSHGMDHVPWPLLDDAGLRRELVDARRALADAAGRPIEVAALPLGRYDRRTLAALRREGYRNVFSSDRRRGRPGSWLQPRFSVRAGDGVPDVLAWLGRPGLLAGARGMAAGTLKRLR